MVLSRVSATAMFTRHCAKSGVKKGSVRVLRTSRKIISSRNRRRKVALHLAGCSSRKREGGCVPRGCVRNNPGALFTLADLAIFLLRRPQHLFSLRIIKLFSICAAWRREGKKSIARAPAGHFIDALNFRLQQMSLSGNCFAARTRWNVFCCTQNAVACFEVSRCVPTTLKPTLGTKLFAKCCKTTRGENFATSYSAVDNA